MRALIVAAEGTTDEEYVYPFYRLQEAGFDVHVSTPTHSPVRGVAGVKIVPTGEYHLVFGSGWFPELLVLPGGVKAIEKLRQQRSLIAFIAEHHMRRGFIASICHGAQLLISAGLCKGRLISGYYSIRDDITNAGGSYSENPVIDGRIASCAHYKDMPAWMAATLREVGA